MIEALVEEGYYPMELTLLQETSITLTELDSMDEERKWMFYYYIIYNNQKEGNEVEPITQGKGRKVHINFPDDFVSSVKNKEDK